MARKKWRFLRVIGWVLAGLLIFLLLSLTAIYLGRDRILQRTVQEFNARYPGELRMEALHLVPLRHFPDVVLQLNQLRIYPDRESADNKRQAFLVLDDLFLFFKPWELFRREVLVHHIRLENGELAYTVFGDSLSSLEHALGTEFGMESPKEKPEGATTFGIDLRKMEWENIRLAYADSLTGFHANLQVDHLYTTLSSEESTMESTVAADLGILELALGSVHLEERKNLSLEVDLELDQLFSELRLNKMMMEVAGMELSISGDYNFSRNEIDATFHVFHAEKEVLELLLSEILEMDEILQVRQGSINLEGRMEGPFAGVLPRTVLKGEVRDLDLVFPSHDREVKEISFRVEAFSGQDPDLRELRLGLQDFRARIGDEWIAASLDVKNLRSPMFDMVLRGGIRLEGLEDLFVMDPVGQLSGGLYLEADLAGSWKPGSAPRFHEGGRMQLDMNDVAMVLATDSLKSINGSLLLEDSLLSCRQLELEFRGNHAVLDLELENILQYLSGEIRDVAASVGLQAGIVHTDAFLGDSSLQMVRGGTLHGLGIRAETRLSSEQMRALREERSLPPVQLYLDSLSISIPQYAPISELEASLTFNPGNLELHALEGRVGQSAFQLSANLEELLSWLKKEEGAVARVELALSADHMQAEDFFRVNDQFLLPEAYEKEGLEDFVLSGALEIPALDRASGGSFGHPVDSQNLRLRPDLLVELGNASWKFRDYPLIFTGFQGSVKMFGDEIQVDSLRGRIGESDFRMSALVGNYRDSSVEKMYGNMVLESELIDINALLNYGPKDTLATDGPVDTGGVRQVPTLDQIAYPDFNFTVDLGELRYGANTLYGIKGDLRSTPDGIFYLDSLETSAESGGSVLLDGQFNVSNAHAYNFSADLKLENVDVNDLNFELQVGDSIYQLKETFDGRVNAEGLAEVFISPDLKLDVANTTAMFTVHVEDGRLMNFTPLEAIGNYLDNRDLKNVRFSELDNNFTLFDSQLLIPRMRVESTIGSLILEGEQGLDGSYLYLVRLPTWLVKEALVGRLTGKRNEEDETEEDEIRELELGKYMMLTPWSDGEKNKVRIGDKRDRYR
jgi:hypothetical protein